MVTIERMLAGLIPYRTVFFPTRAALAQGLDSLAPTRVARYFWAETDLNHPLVVRHERTATICIDLRQPLDKILAAMSQSTRRKVRSAEKLGDRMAIKRNHPEAARELVSLYNALAHAKVAGVSPIDEGIVARYAPHSDIQVVHLDGEPLCTHLNMRDPDSGRARIIFTANRRFEDHDTARLCGFVNSYLHWHEILTYREEGFGTYDFGGISTGENAGIDQFKHGFGGAVVNENTYLCAGSPAFARTLLKFREVLRPSPRFEAATEA